MTERGGTLQIWKRGRSRNDATKEGEKVKNQEKMNANQREGSKQNREKKKWDIKG